MDFELRVPCLAGFTNVSCKNCHICLNSLTALNSISCKQQQYLGNTFSQNNKISQKKMETAATSTSTSFSTQTTSNPTLCSSTASDWSWRRLCAFLILLNLFASAAGCGPSRGIGGPRIKRKLTPLVFKQHVPNMSEQSLGASGISEGAISRDSVKFKKLEFNNNRDIIFKDEEGTGADHVMTRRCKEKLNTLAISVMNQWPGVRLRVTESWDEEYLHDAKSLHYEGRAVDITTSDRDRSKYGMLARLAVEAGFDWVYYETRAHIHCSVKSDSFHSPHENGCFAKDSTVLLQTGEHKAMSDLTIGDRVLSMNEKGEPVYSEIILFLDRNLDMTEEFVQLTTQTGAQLTLTAAHLLMVWNPDKQMHDYMFADRIQQGDQVFVFDDTGLLRPQKVIDLKAVLRKGFVAPLTREGTIVVNSVAASCYAIVNSQTLAHWSLAPIRVWSAVKERVYASLPSLSKSMANSTAQQYNGIHWYAKTLYSLKDYVLPKSWRH